jgi:hypothetical protein
MMEALRSLKGRFLEEPRGATSQKTAVFIVPAAKTSNLIRAVETSVVLL